VRKAELLLQRRNHRGDARSYVINFLPNFSQYARFMRKFLPIRHGERDLVQVAMKAYINCIGKRGVPHVSKRRVLVRAARMGGSRMRPSSG